MANMPTAQMFFSNVTGAVNGELEWNGMTYRHLAHCWRFVCYFHFVSWDAIAFGVSLHLRARHAEIHLPFGFIRVGFEERHEGYYPLQFGRDRSWGRKMSYHAKGANDF